MTINYILRIIFLMLVPLFITAQNIPKTYVAHSTTESIHIDGIASETSWKNVSWSSDFIDIEGSKKPLYRTRMKMIWDAEYLYFYAQMEEPHVWATLKQRDTIIFYNNDFEIFIDPDGDTHNYMEFEMNALNTVWDLFLTKPYRNGGKVLNGWDIQGLKSAVHINGTLNNPTDKDTNWSVEIAIPWSVLNEAAPTSKLPVNHFWRINFSRVNWDYDLTEGGYARKKDSKGKPLPEYNWVWSPQGVINMHEPEHWGYVYFSDASVSEDIIFEIPKDEHIKWKLYEKYRELLVANDNFDSIIKKISDSTSEILGEPLKLTIEQHLTGWTIWTVSPFTGKIMLIDEDGKFNSYEKQK